MLTILAGKGVSGLVVLLVVSYTVLYGQPTENWVASYNGPAGKADKARAMVIDNNNNVIVTGPSDGAKKGNIDYATIKYDPNGQKLWVARFNGPGNDEDWPYAVSTDAAGNVYVTGRSLGPGKEYDYATIKYNSAGIQQWVAIYNSLLNDIAMDIKVDDDGNVYVTGGSKGPNASVGSHFAITTIKYNSAGDQQWAVDNNSLPDAGTASNYEEGNSLALDESGNVYVAGKRGLNRVVIKYDHNGIQQWEYEGIGSEDRKVLLDHNGNVYVTGFSGTTTKLDPSGARLWETSEVGAGFWDLALDGSGNVYVTGSDNANGTGSDFRTIKYNSNGIPLWSARYNGSANSVDFARSIALDQQGNTYVTGYTTIQSGKRSTTAKMGIVKYNVSGSELWSIADAPGSGGFAIKTDEVNDVLVTGETTTNNFDFITYKYPGGGGTLVSSSVKPDIVESMQTLQLRSYPNPFASATTIEYQLRESSPVRMSVVDLTGREVKLLVNKFQEKGTYRVSFSGEHLPAATYLLRFQSKSLAETRKLVLVK